MDANYRKSYWLYETTIPQNDRLVLSKTMLRSKSFVKLTGAAKQILIELYIRLTLECDKSRNRRRGDERYFAKNNGTLILRYSDIHKMFGYSSRTISKALNKLVQYGFIEIAILGCGVKRQSHKIALITNWQKYGTPEFKPGLGKADGPVNTGFKKRKNLEITVHGKEGIPLQSKEGIG